MTNKKTRSPRFTGQRGSALLVGMMVTVGLTLLGLGFVAVSETESAISINERNSQQVFHLAEAGAKIVVEWYQNPQWATSMTLMPASTAAHTAAFKRVRMIDTNGDGNLENVGRYKDYGTTVAFCCDRPFKPLTPDRLWGTEASPDILIDRTTTEGRAYLDSLNTLLFQNNAGGRITDIRIYAPPVLNANVNAQGFIDADPPGLIAAPTRYGLATVRVAAQLDSAAGRPAGASRFVKMVISEYPFPGPQGPVQSNANIATGGNMVVHWGKMTSQGTMFVKRPLVGLPWFDAYTRLPLDKGYDSCTIWKANTAYEQGDVICPTPVKINAQPAGSTLPQFAYAITSATSTYPVAATEPAFESNVTVDGVFTHEGVTYRTRQRPISTIDRDSTLLSERYPWSYTVPGATIADPWIEVRSRGGLTNAIITSAPTAPADRSAVYHPFKYSSTAMDMWATPEGGWSNWFQLQTQDLPRDQQKVTFPRIDYDFWKQVAKTGKGTEGVYYLEWVADDRFTNGSTVRTFKEWTNIFTGAKAGFYFFDTTNKQSPQVAGANNLTPAVTISSGGGNTWQMSGFIYLNATTFGTSGIIGIDGYYGFPGEPFQDTGVFEPDPAGNWMWNAGTGRYVTKGRADNNWTSIDFNNNGKVDIFLRQITKTLPNGTPSASFWFPVPYSPGCTVGDNTVLGANCSDPHEPYINLIYPLNACCGGASAPIPLVTGWEDPASTITRRPKKKRDDQSMPPVNGSDICSDSTDFDKRCTSNGYDRDGYLDYWSGVQDAPVLNGVFYNEGSFSSTGNARMFGSVLINGNVDPNGTNEVWFDERLIKNDWPPKEWPFPRAIVTAVETDQ